MNTSADQLLDKLLNKRDLSESTAYKLMEDLAQGSVDPVLAGELLVALSAKGESPEEVRGFALAMRDLATSITLETSHKTIDIVGTGGDGSNSYNLSTGTALLAASCGLSVVKHGNRSVSSKSGSADVLEALGVPLSDNVSTIQSLLSKHNFVFLFAPFFHPAMKNIAPIRQALGVRTVFNILGPLTNPAKPRYYLLGAFSSEMAKLMAEAMSGMDIDRAFIIHGNNGWDEPTPIAPFEIYDVTSKGIHLETRDPQEFGIPKCNNSDLLGGDASHNAKAVLDVFNNKDQGPHRDALALGTALALELTGAVDSMSQGITEARDTIRNGTAAEFINNLILSEK